MRRALVSQHLQPRALDQGARDRGYAQGDPRGEDLAAAREKAIRVIEKLRGLRLSRAAELVEAAIEETLAYYAFPEAAWQRCVVHWYRNIFSHVPSTKVREVAAMLKAIHAGEDAAAAREKALQVIEKLRALRLTRAAELAAASFEETISYYSFPKEHLAARYQQPT